MIVPLFANRRVGAGVSDMEAVVRPFYVAAPVSPAPRPLTPQPGEAFGVLRIEINVRPDVITMPAMGFTVNFGGNTENEVTRVVHEERVTNPEDAEQYVDVEVIDRITFRNASKKKKYTLTLNN